MSVGSFTDQLGRKIQISIPLKRIISLVPSQTELLFNLGLDEEIIGVTKFCIHPHEKVRSKIKIGGTKNLSIEKIKSLQPDLIIGNKEENDEQQIDDLMKYFPVWISDVKTAADAYEMMRRLGEMVGKNEQANALVKRIKSAVSSWQLAKRKVFDSCCYLIWNNPMMTVGKDTFIHQMLSIAGFENVFGDHLRYPEITFENIKSRSPQFLLLSSEPFPFSQKHADGFQSMLPDTKILLVDGEMFSWYGSRLLKAIPYFKNLHYLTA